MRPDAPDAPPCGPTSRRWRGRRLPRRRGGTRLLLTLARARHSSGNPASAVDAALWDIFAVVMGEEADAATLYLESPMEIRL